MTSARRFATATSQINPHGATLEALLAAATQAADPQQQITRTISVATTGVTIGGSHYTPSSVVLLAVGKAALTMADAAMQRLGGLVSHGLVIYKDDDGTLRHPQLVYHAAGHPVPDARSLMAGQLARQLVQQADPTQLIVVLVSGGGSALMVDPLPGIDLAQMQQLTRDLLASGADINAINTIRRRIDGVKGGGLARAAGATPMVTLILSDVIGNPLAAIASGPTVANPDSAQAAWDVVQQAGLKTVSPAITTALTAPLPPDHTHYATPLIIGDIQQALAAAAQVAQQAGYTPIILSDTLNGEAREVGRTLGHIAAYHARHGQRICLLAGGETTVTLRGNGLGGRNQELALGAALSIQNIPNLLCAAYASDGGDGPSDAAGAVVDGQTVARAKAAGQDAHDTLARNDSYYFFDAIADLLKPGATGTNVNDLFVALL
jgi:hydroxypyruvate reductase